MKNIGAVGISKKFATFANLLLKTLKSGRVGSFRPAVCLSLSLALSLQQQGFQRSV
jgi:hypothetical protein